MPRDRLPSRIRCTSFLVYWIAINLTELLPVGHAAEACSAPSPHRGGLYFQTESGNMLAVYDAHQGRGRRRVFLLGGAVTAYSERTTEGIQLKIVNSSEPGPGFEFNLEGKSILADGFARITLDFTPHGRPVRITASGSGRVYLDDRLLVGEHPWSR